MKTGWNVLLHRLNCVLYYNLYATEYFLLSLSCVIIFSIINYRVHCEIILTKNTKKLWTVFSDTCRSGVKQNRHPLMNGFESAHPCVNKCEVEFISTLPIFSFAAKITLLLLNVNCVTVFTQIFVCTVAYSTFLSLCLVRTFGYYPSTSSWLVCLCGKRAMRQWCWHINSWCLKRPLITLKGVWAQKKKVYNTRHFNISLYCLSLSYTFRYTFIILGISWQNA